MSHIHEYNFCSVESAYVFELEISFVITSSLVHTEVVNESDLVGFVYYGKLLFFFTSNVGDIFRVIMFERGLVHGGRRYRRC